MVPDPCRRINVYRSFLCYCCWGEGVFDRRADHRSGQDQREGFPCGFHIFAYVLRQWMVSVAYGFSVASDIILAGILVFTLLRIRRESKVRSTRTVLNTLIIYTINTGLLTSIVSFFAFLFAIVMRGNFIYAGISIVGAKLYANSVLALLNSRRYLHDRLQDDFSSVSMDSSETSSTSQPPMRPAHPPRGRAGDETSTIVWAVRQQSTCMSTVSTQMNFAVPPGLQEGPESQV
ncbi:hypothetical protein C8Q70DRAFT_1015449 [Cubamyces menziesii]|nr:hypothetical protein C8Q70DRAFT_1015449 [Cubamyces menziesii]